MPTLRRVDGRPTWLLSRANARAQTILREAFEAAGVRGYDFRVLAALDEHGPVSQAELGRHTGIDRSDVVATVNRLVESGWARRDQDPVDRRRNVVTITRRGRAQVERLDAVLAGVQAMVMAPLSDREQATLGRLLAKLG